jgi:hypothetical protein
MSRCSYPPRASPSFPTIAQHAFGAFLESHYKVPAELYKDALLSVQAMRDTIVMHSRDTSSLDIHFSYYHQVRASGFYLRLPRSGPFFSA